MATLEICCYCHDGQRLGLPYNDLSPPGLQHRHLFIKYPRRARQRRVVCSPIDANNSKSYSFVALPFNAAKKRPRRRYDELQCPYQCSWSDCTKAYGTLNHLNAHITMQKHDLKRSPNGEHSSISLFLTERPDRVQGGTKAVAHAKPHLPLISLVSWGVLPWTVYNQEKIPTKGVK